MAKVRKVVSVGDDVVEQSEDSSLDNSEPVTFRQIIAQGVGILVAVLLFKGVIEPQEGALLGAQSDVIVGAVMLVAGVVGAVAGRMKAYSPKTAAYIAVQNAATVSGDPVLVTPP